MIPQFLIVFREALEAGLIVGIVAAYLTRIGRSKIRRYLYFGATLAVILSVLLGAIVSATLGSLEGKAEQIFEGTASLTAAIVLTYMIVWMARNARTIRADLERRIDISVETNQMIGIFGLAFVSVLREGIETVLFLSALVVSDPFGTMLGIFLGIGAVLVLAILMIEAIGRIKLAELFRYTSVILLIFAAGLTGFGIHELVEAYEDDIPVLLRQEAWNVNPPDPDHPLHEKGAIGSVLKALVGYDGNPEVIRVIAYFAYWIIVGSQVLRTYRAIPRKHRQRA